MKQLYQYLKDLDITEYLRNNLTIILAKQILISYDSSFSSRCLVTFIKYSDMP